MPFDDLQLVTNILAGQDDSLRELILRYEGLVFRFIYRFVYDAPEAEDLTQEVFIRVWRHLRKFDTSKNFRTWLLTIARNVSLDFLKKRRALTFSEIDSLTEDSSITESIADDLPLPPDILSRLELRQDLAALIEILPVMDQQILNMHFYEELTFPEIAEVLDASINTVKSRARRALLKLRENIVNLDKNI